MSNNCSSTSSCMSSRERVLTALSHRETDRIPFDIGFGLNAPVQKSLAAHLGISTKDLPYFLAGYTDIKRISPDYIGPADRNLVRQDGARTDIWGVARKPVIYGSGERAGVYNEICTYPLGDTSELNDLDRHIWPSADWWDVSGICEKARRIGRQKENEYALCMGNGNIFETSWYMRGFEQMLTDLLTEPELAWEIMTRVTDYFISFFRKVLEAAGGMIDIIFTADDIGQQQGLLTSLDLWAKMIKPHHVRMNKVLHEYGVKIMYHTDGAVMEAVPGLIDMGIDILEPLQFDAKGMDPQLLKDEYGDKLCFRGGISVQSTLPLGTPGDVRAEVRERIRVLGNGGGYIFGPSHAVQAGTPPENVIALLDEVKKKC